MFLCRAISLDCETMILNKRGKEIAKHSFESLPIPCVSNKNDVYLELEICVKELLKYPKDAKLLKDLDYIVYKLYNLNSEEIEIVKEIEIRNTKKEKSSTKPLKRSLY
jgi:hypothetical protein